MLNIQIEKLFRHTEKYCSRFWVSRKGVLIAIRQLGSYMGLASIARKIGVARNQIRLGESKTSAGGKYSLFKRKVGPFQKESRAYAGGKYDLCRMKVQPRREDGKTSAG